MSRLTMCASLLNDSAKNGYSILDIGCRGKELKGLLTGVGTYQGVDLHEDDEVMFHDLEKKIPIDDASFDVVVALDVVEHVENAHQLVSEMLRISRDKVIVSLPNMYHWKYRIRMLRGKDIGAKYRFPVRPIKDRHRWLTSYDNSREFILENSIGFHVEILPVIVERALGRKIFQYIDAIGSKLFPNFFAYGGMYVLTKENKV